MAAENKLEIAVNTCADLLKELVEVLRDPAARNEVIAALNNSFKREGESNNGGEMMILYSERAVRDWKSATEEFLASQSGINGKVDGCKEGPPKGGGNGGEG